MLVGGGVIRSRGRGARVPPIHRDAGRPSGLHHHGRRRLPRRTIPLFTGMMGMHGSHASNYAPLTECDLLIAIGCRFSDRVATDPATFARNAKIVHIDIDRAEIDKNVLTDHHIIGDARRVLELLNEKLPTPRLP